MRRLLGTLVLLVAVILGVGVYQGWFQFSKETSDNKTSVTLSVDEAKIKADAEKAEKELKELGNKAKEKISGGADKDKK